MEVSATELSKLLGVAPDTIQRWGRQGKLPVLKTGKGYKFRTDELKKWAKINHINLQISDSPVPGNRTGSSPEDILTLPEAICNGGIHYNIKGNNKEQVLARCVAEFTHIPAHQKADLIDCLIQREQALSTGLGNGFAVPHPRNPMDFLDTSALSVCFLNTPIEYNALDQQPVSILFFLLCPDLSHHLHLLSTLSFCLKDNAFTLFLKSIPEPDELIRQIKTLQAEKQISS